MKLTASNIVKAIDLLAKDQWFDYISDKSTTRVSVVAVTKPEGPIAIKRYNPTKGGPSTATESSISVQML